MNFSPLDIVFIVILAIAAIRCTFRGFVEELFTFASVFGSILAAILFHRPLAVLLNSVTGASAWNPFIAFLIIFLVLYLIIKLIERVLHNFIDKVELERLDQALGLFLGIIEGLFLIVAIVFLLKIQQFFNIGTLIEDSFIGSLIITILPDNFFQLSGVI